MSHPAVWLQCNAVERVAAVDGGSWGPLGLQPALLAFWCFQVFTRTCDSTRKIALTLRNLGFGGVPIHGQMSQPKRLGALNKFKSGERSILVATDVASREAGHPISGRRHQL